MWNIMWDVDCIHKYYTFNNGKVDEIYNPDEIINGCCQHLSGNFFGYFVDESVLNVVINDKVLKIDPDNVNCWIEHIRNSTEKILIIYNSESQVISCSFKPWFVNYDDLSDPACLPEDLFNILDSKEMIRYTIAHFGKKVCLKLSE